MPSGDKLMDLVHHRAEMFVEANYRHPEPRDYVLVESAILIGISLASEALAVAEEPLMGERERVTSQIDNLIDKLWNNG